MDKVEKMIENIKLMFMSIGVGAVAFMVAYALAICKIKLKKWKSTGCKIKCLCNHEYNIETVSHCQNSIFLRCEKCGKLKTIKGLTPKTIDMIFEVEKMKNKEKYAEEIIEIACNGSNIALSKDTAKPIKCESIRCYKCAFRNENGCYTVRRKWAESEYIEKPVINKKDRKFLEYLDNRYKYIARNKNNLLRVWINKPVKEKGFPAWYHVTSANGELDDFLIDFPMVKWEDKEPWLIEDLKKLKVVDSYE